MSKHTPGPWFSIDGRVKHSSGDIASAWLPREVDETRLDGESWIDMRNRTQPERDSRDAEVIANARVIAAAPELLEALEGLLSAYEKLDGHVTHQGSWHSHAVSAIAKAKGEK